MTQVDRAEVDSTLTVWCHDNADCMNSLQYCSLDKFTSGGGLTQPASTVALSGRRPVQARWEMNCHLPRKCSLSGGDSFRCSR
jgi:hypothetical protein